MPDDTRTDDGSVKATRHTWSVLAPDAVIDMLDVPQVSTYARTIQRLPRRKFR
jgi:hypothetical protein